jgi:glutathione S-transferase
LLNKLSIDVGLFRFGVQMIPLEAPMLQDPAFVKDRSEFFGRPWSAEQRAENRPQGIVHMRQCFDIIESLLDGKKWVGGTDKPTLADLEGEEH